MTCDKSNDFQLDVFIIYGRTRFLLRNLFKCCNDGLGFIEGISRQFPRVIRWRSLCKQGPHNTKKKKENLRQEVVIQI